MTTFKQCYDIDETAVQGEFLSANADATVFLHNEFQKFIVKENLKPDQIYNVEVQILLSWIWGCVTRRGWDW
jgi:hypothetical protein